MQAIWTLGVNPLISTAMGTRMSNEHGADGGDGDEDGDSYVNSDYGCDCGDGGAFEI